MPSGRRHNRREGDIEQGRHPQMQTHDDRENVHDYELPCNRAMCGCLGLIAFISMLLLVILLPPSLSYIRYNQYAFKKNTISNFVDQSQVYENGRHFWGLFQEPVLFPKTFQRVSFNGNDLMVFSRGSQEGETGLEFALECDVFYRLGKENISDIYTKFANTYQDRFVDAIRASVKNSAPNYQVDEYITHRHIIEEAIAQELNHDLADLHFGIENWKFMLRRTVFPSKIRDIFLKTSVQELNNDKSVLEQEVLLIKKETEEQVQEIQANITIVEQVAIAQATALVKKGHAEAARISQEATGQGLNYFLDTLNITSQADRSRVFRLLAVMDNPTSPKVIVGSGANTLISV